MYLCKNKRIVIFVSLEFCEKEKKVGSFPYIMKAPSEDEKSVNDAVHYGRYLFSSSTTNSLSNIILLFGTAFHSDDDDVLPTKVVYISFPLSNEPSQWLFFYYLVNELFQSTFSQNLSTVLWSLRDFSC